MKSPLLATAGASQKAKVGRSSNHPLHACGLTAASTLTPIMGSLALLRQLHPSFYAHQSSFLPFVHQSSACLGLSGYERRPSQQSQLTWAFKERLSTMGPYYCFWNTIMCVFFPKNEQKIPKKQTKIRPFCFHFQKWRHCRISFSFHCLFSKPCPISCCWKRGNQVEKTGKWTWKIWELRMFELQHLQCNFVIWIEWNCLWLC